MWEYPFSRKDNYFSYIRLTEQEQFHSWKLLDAVLNELLWKDIPNGKVEKGNKGSRTSGYGPSKGSKVSKVKLAVLYS